MNDDKQAPGANDRPETWYEHELINADALNWDEGTMQEKMEPAIFKVSDGCASWHIIAITPEEAITKLKAALAYEGISQEEIDGDGVEWNATRYPQNEYIVFTFDDGRKIRLMAGDWVRIYDGVTAQKYITCSEH